MAHKPGGTEQLEAAKTLLKKAKTADELRAAQAIVLPLALGLSLARRACGAMCVWRICKWSELYLSLAGSVNANGAQLFPTINENET